MLDCWFVFCVLRVCYCRRWCWCLLLFFICLLCRFCCCSCTFCFCWFCLDCYAVLVLWVSFVLHMLLVFSIVSVSYDSSSCFSSLFSSSCSSYCFVFFIFVPSHCPLCFSFLFLMPCSFISVFLLFVCIHLRLRCFFVLLLMM